jgi:polyphosphate kinase 2 (PPK2 family)
MLVPKTPRRRKHVLSDLAVAHPLAREPYEKQLGELQGKIARQARKLAEDQRSLVLVFEGNDAAGKGGAIRRITQAVDARLWRVIGTAAPTDEERAHPYLWRFWRHIPRHGQITIYDRSWYGRVLVERVEGFAAEAEWRRAFHEISDFESQLVESGTTIVKFWLGVTQEEQLRRFKDRKETPWKQYKLTEEDWRNRGRWNAYELAAVDMIERTSAPQAPWVVVAADDKRAARIKVLGEVLSALRRARGKG